MAEGYTVNELFPFANQSHQINLISEIGRRTLEQVQRRKHVTAICWSPDASRIVCGTHGGNLTVWSIGLETQLNFELHGHTKKITSIAWSPGTIELKQTSGARRTTSVIVTVSLESILIVWDAQAY